MQCTPHYTHIKMQFELIVVLKRRSIRVISQMQMKSVTVLYILHIDTGEYMLFTI